ncbi:hypothetical protein ES319_D08G169700v1 [Gossypium barbadense]|uniref:Uncharacterized protein n=2 Tax=Gossypium TaxID=3633 RepID=A0A5J5QFJ7_GOSBA|nr:hypothetical protein ES319_D08G169700v1 [Gossypium barbadense]TYG57915.1 hypothetical protein ES288_D08G180100v1 [Gossypium darwinii]
MRKIRGFKIKKWLVRISSQHLIKGAKSIWSSKSGFSYVPIGQGPINEKLTTVLKGHLVVYVGQKDNDYHRVLVSIIYFNHPLSDELLREAEEEYGFSHQGGITISCLFL